MNGKVRLVNLTPHEVRLVDEDGTVLLSVKPSGTVARVDETVTEAGSVRVNGVDVPVSEVRTGTVSGVPARAHGVLYVVSRAVAAAMPNRDDLVVPHPLVRDESGRVIGARGLARIRAINSDGSRSKKRTIKTERNGNSVTVTTPEATVTVKRTWTVDEMDSGIIHDVTVITVTNRDGERVQEIVVR